MDSDTIIVGITGGIGAGKSTVTNHLKSLGHPVFDCDKAVHELYDNEIMKAWLAEKFGAPSVGTREFMAGQVVADASVLSQLEAMFKPGINMLLRKFLKEHEHHACVFMDAPLLFEHGMDPQCEFIVSVLCPEETRRARVMQRPGMTKEKLDLIISKQITDGERITRSQFLVHNNGDISDVHKKVSEIVLRIMDYVSEK